MLKKRQTLELGIVCDRGRTQFLIRVPAIHQRTIIAQLLNAYPGASVAAVEEFETSGVTHEQRFRLSPDSVSMKLHSDFVEEHSKEPIDPIEGLLEAVKSGGKRLQRTEYWLSLRQASLRNVDNSTWCGRFVDATFRFPALKRCFLRHASGRSMRSRALRKFATYGAAPLKKNDFVEA